MAEDFVWRDHPRLIARSSFEPVPPPRAKLATTLLPLPGHPSFIVWWGVDHTPCRLAGGKHASLITNAFKPMFDAVAATAFGEGAPCVIVSVVKPPLLCAADAITDRDMDQEYFMSWQVHCDNPHAPSRFLSTVAANKTALARAYTKALTGEATKKYVAGATSLYRDLFVTEQKVAAARGLSATSAAAAPMIQSFSALNIYTGVLVLETPDHTARAAEDLEAAKSSILASLNELYSLRLFA